MQITFMERARILSYRIVQSYLELTKLVCVRARKRKRKSDESEEIMYSTDTCGFMSRKIRRPEEEESASKFRFRGAEKFGLQISI